MNPAERERNRVRIETLDAYGGVCVCCGETEPWFLTIEHSNKDGAEQRALLGHNGKGVNFYRWLRQRDYPKDMGLTVLCHNCNHTSYWRECPHQSGVGLRDQVIARTRKRPEEVTHGDLAMYNRGCRCDPCRAAQSTYMAECYQNRKAKSHLIRVDDKGIGDVTIRESTR